MSVLSPRAPSLVLSALLLAVTGCGAGTLSSGVVSSGQSVPLCETDINEVSCLDCDREEDGVCTSPTLRLQPGDAVTLTFELLGEGSFAGDYAVSTQMLQSGFEYEDVALSADTVTLDDAPVTVDLSFQIPSDACGSGSAGVQAEALDGPPDMTLASASVSLEDADGPIFCP